MKRSKAVPLGVVATVASLALAAGCGRTPTHQQVCGDERGFAVDPRNCEQQARQQRVHGGAFVPLYFWYYAPFGNRYSAGSSLTGATRTMPTGSGVRIASPTRAGFGQSAQPAGA